MEHPARRQANSQQQQRARKLWVNNKCNQKSLLDHKFKSCEKSNFQNIMYKNIDGIVRHEQEKNNKMCN